MLTPVPAGCVNTPETKSTNREMRSREPRSQPAFAVMQLLILNIINRKILEKQDIAVCSHRPPSLPALN